MVLNVNKAKKQLRLLHTSDLHIGSDIYPDEAMRGFETILQQADQTSPDALIIAGDLFDHHRVPDAIVGSVFEELGSLAVPVVILPGNHDAVLTDGRLSDDLPKNITVMKEADGDTIFLDSLGLTLWGRPVYNHHPDFRPLEGMPSQSPDSWFVAVAHGLFMEVPDPMRSSPIAPEEIAQASCDYVALGHVHVFRDVSQNGIPAFYSGAPSGSQAKTTVLVELDPTAGVSVSTLAIP